MNISFLIQMLQNKITALTNAKSQAVSIGDFEQVAVIEKELLDTQNTFSQLAMLSDMTTAATNANTTPVEIISAGLDKIQNTQAVVENTVIVVGPSAEAIVNGYDISAYATDPEHEKKIQNLVDSMPAMVDSKDVDNYIQSVAEGSPVTGDMVIVSADKYKIDMLLLLAIMQNDSSFGTEGVGARTNNPGNVGNTGTEERSYPTWDEGVDAVAQWLSRHKVANV